MKLNKLFGEKSRLMIYLILFCFSFSAIAQETKNGTIISRPADGAYCEMNKVFLENIFREQKENNEKLFVIVGSGNNEKTNINRARLGSAKTFLIKFMKFSEESVIFAEEFKKNEVGAIQFYLGSKLFLIIEQPLNKISCFTCCEDFIPKKTRTRKK
jgi:hypothetical protein